MHMALLLRIVLAQESHPILERWIVGMRRMVLQKYDIIEERLSVGVGTFFRTGRRHFFVGELCPIDLQIEVFDIFEFIEPIKLIGVSCIVESSVGRLNSDGLISTFALIV